MLSHPSAYHIKSFCEMHTRSIYMVIVAVAVAAVSFVFMFLASRNLFNDKSGIRLHVLFPIAEGLEPGIDVIYFGDVVGRVVRVKKDNKRLLAELVIMEEPKIKRSFAPCFVSSDIASKRSNHVVFKRIEKSRLVNSLGLSNDLVELPFVDGELVGYGLAEGVEEEGPYGKSNGTGVVSEQLPNEPE
ncbi:hypothetical protein Poly21_48440 [Allorhodopirellula heiligendammensis]|uniref:Mce/MlaD domain-containing protein n=2 Tax=Allorhodopirellula heiligendammensis TaxID=2714739 RepID=A0A5C6BFV5_9BACT|nr:hypothetical protein Poly21_48440 [Allorhodopirellula heiligendammensis]